MPNFYAVACGHKTGVFNTWDECKENTAGFRGARYKKFPTLQEAEDFVAGRTPGGGGSGGGNPLKSAPRTPGAAGKNLSAADKAQLETLQAALDEIEAEVKAYLAKKEKEKAKIRSKMDAITGGNNNRDKSSSPPPAKKVKKTTTRDDGLFEDEDGFVHVYTDGACSMNGRKGARAGIGVYFAPAHALNVSQPISKGARPTNNVAEIEAAIAAIRAAKSAGIKQLVVNTDSQFMINCMCSWIHGWKRKGWVTAEGKPVKNKDDLVVLDEEMNGEDADIVVRWNHVRGHAGIEGNERADALAREGAQRYGNE